MNDRIVRGTVYAGLAAALVLSPLGAHAQTPTKEQSRALAQLEAILELSTLSGELWPGWDISETPFALCTSSGVCYLIGHPLPPPSFTRVREDLLVQARVYYGPLDSEGVEPESGELNGVPTAFVWMAEAADEMLPAGCREAFRMHQREACPELSEPVSIRLKYPDDPKLFALVDLECELLRRAVDAPADSVWQRACEFVAVRAFRDIHTMGRFVQFERHAEFLGGLPAYIGERSRQQCRPFLRRRWSARLRGAVGASKNLLACLGAGPDLEWYRVDRLECTGAAICLLLDELRPEWRDEVSDRCIEPYRILEEITYGHRPSPKALAERYDLEGRTQERSVFIDMSKSEPERAYEKIVKGPGPFFCVTTNLLTGARVSFDPENFDRVDDHREVHRRFLRVEYSGGTYVSVKGRPIAAVVGAGEFDYEHLIFAAPDEYTVTVDGEPLPLEPGVHQVDRPISVEAEGISIAAQVAVVVVGEDRITFVLHQ